jgi:hypothetical protein
LDDPAPRADEPAALNDLTFLLQILTGCTLIREKPHIRDTFRFYRSIILI